MSLAAVALVGCGGGVKPYQSQGPDNLRLNLSAPDSTVFTQRSVYLDVWTGPKGPEMEYLGTVKLSPGLSAVGLPTGRPLHLALAFEEAGALRSHSNVTTVELPISAVPSGGVWQIDVGFTRKAFTHDMRRLR